MATECVASLSRYFLFLFNVVWFLAGSFLLGAGTWILADKSSFIGFAQFMMNLMNKDTAVEEETQHFLESLTKHLNMEQFAYAFIAIGAIILIISAFGTLGSARESRCLLILYGSFILLLVLLQIGVIAITAANKPNVEAQIKNGLRTSIDKYYDEKSHIRKNAITAMWDLTMTELQCCGVEDYKDFSNSNFESVSRHAPKAGSLPRTDGIPISYEEYHPLFPRSCCKKSTLDEFKQKNEVNFFSESDLSCVRDPSPSNSNMNIGCYNVIREEVIQNKNLAYGIIVGIIGGQIFILLLVLLLCKAIGRYNYNMYDRQGYPTRNNIQRF